MDAFDPEPYRMNNHYHNSLFKLHLLVFEVREIVLKNFEVSFISNHKDILYNNYLIFKWEHEMVHNIFQF